MAHELGHSLGLPHAPCGTSGGPYPYPEAKIGVWGYSLSARMLRDPDEYYDLMSYCDPSFISDYNFEQLFERIRYLNLQFESSPSRGARYTRVLVDRSGARALRGTIELDAAPGGHEEQRAGDGCSIAAGRDSATVPAYYFPFSEAAVRHVADPEHGAAAARIGGVDGVGTVVLR